MGMGFPFGVMRLFRNLIEMLAAQLFSALNAIEITSKTLVFGIPWRSSV